MPCKLFSSGDRHCGEGSDATGQNHHPQGKTLILARLIYLACLEKMNDIKNCPQVPAKEQGNE